MIIKAKAHPEAHFEALVTHVRGKDGLGKVPVHNFRQLSDEIEHFGHLLGVAAVQHPQWHYFEFFVILHAQVNNCDKAIDVTIYVIILCDNDPSFRVVDDRSLTMQQDLLTVERQGRSGQVRTCMWPPASCTHLPYMAEEGLLGFGPTWSIT